MFDGKAMNCRITDSDLEITEINRRCMNTDNGNVFGIQRLLNKKYNKGLAFTQSERQLLGLTGLLAPAVKTDVEQIEQCFIILNRIDDKLDKYIFLNQLSQLNERLFYKVVRSNLAEILPIIYSPTIGDACLNFSLLNLTCERPSALYISCEEKGHIFDVLKNWPEQDIRAICVTDGERILGLGDLGVNGTPIPIGKLMLYTAVGGIKPNQLLPIMLDVGTNRKHIREDPLYVGLRRKRLARKEYDEFIDEFMKSVIKKYGRNCLIQFEDFGNSNAFRLLHKYQHKYCTFNDDIQGGAAVVLAGIFTAIKIIGLQITELKVLLYGAGEVGLGVASILLTAMRHEGLTAEQAKERIWLIDSKGLIVKERPGGGLTKEKLEWAHDVEPLDNLLDIVKLVQPHVLLGASCQGRAFTKEVLQTMAEISARPVIIAFSNPTSKAECTAEQAYKHTNGQCLFAAGVSFPPFEHKGKWLFPSIANNSNIFPGIALGVISCGMRNIPDDVFMLVAKKLSELVSNDDLEFERLYPPVKSLTKTSVEIAAAVMDYAYCNGLADFHPEPRDKILFLKHQLYDLEYASALPSIFKDVIDTTKIQNKTSTQDEANSISKRRSTQPTKVTTKKVKTNFSSININK